MSKPPGSRSGKSKIGLPQSELFALGGKSGSRDDKSKVSHVKPVPERKRDSSGPSTLSSVSKKAKLGVSGSPAQRLSGEGSSSSSASLTEAWEQIAIDSEAFELVETILIDIEQHDNDHATGILCGAIKLLSSNRAKNDPILTLSLLYLAKLKPSLFCNDKVTSALISILRRDSQYAFKNRTNPTAHIVACNLLARGYHDKKQWPELFLRTYIEDAANERVWADNEFCSPFITNVCAAFNTKTPPKALLQPELSAASSSTSLSMQIINLDEDPGENTVHPDTLKCASELKLECTVQNRYSNSTHIVEKYVLDAIKEQLNKRQQQESSNRNFLKFLSTTSGIGEVRAMSITRLELWIHNGKLMKPAQELLAYICYNMNAQNVKDTQEVLMNLVKMRLKSKPLTNIFMASFKEMLILQPDILFLALKYVVQNELSNARNSNNMGMLATMFQAKPDLAAKHLAEIYKEFLMQREDCLRTLRIFLRELVKVVRFDMNLVEFCRAFLTSRQDLVPQIQQSEYKNRIFQSMIDLVCLCMFMTVSPQVREANVSLRAGKEMKSNPILMSFYQQMSTIQLDSLTWMYEHVPGIFQPSINEYGQALHKILLLDSPDQYARCDQWPPEPERVALLRIISETPVNEESLLRIILIGISKDRPFNIDSSIEAIEQTIKRASALRCVDCPAVFVQKFDIIDFLFSMAEYHHPENIKLPEDFEPPKLAISILYWKVWNILLMVSAHNPGTFGALCWQQYPTMKMLMELCITNQFQDVKTSEEEFQIIPLEREQILQFEILLAAQVSQTVITEENSILIPQLQRMDPMGPARRPPKTVLDQLQALNSSLKLGHLLCRSRKPDLLLDIIHRQGATQSMPWLSDLVQNSEGDFNHLPVQCLCEFLLSNSANLSSDNSRDVELLNYLQDLLKDSTIERQIVCVEVLEYFFRRLTSVGKQQRQSALTAIKLLLKVFSSEEDENVTQDDWLLRHLPQVPHFAQARSLIIVQLRAACQIENDPELVMVYIQFIAYHTLEDSVNETSDHVVDMAQLIVERCTMFKHIIPIPQDSMTYEQPNTAQDKSRLQTLQCLLVMFNNYVIKLGQHKDAYEYNDYNDLLLVKFHDGTHIPLHLNVIHAFIILLTHSSPLQESESVLDYWFPNKSSIPQAFIPDTNEPYPLLPDWLKLKMIRSPVERLVDAAMYDLTPDQIVLFVQNFGTPINSMSKLLALLDRAVIEQLEASKKAILNKAYLAQLIEIQQARGAKNGHITVQHLGLHSHATTVPDPPKADIVVLDNVNLQGLSSDLPQTSTKGTKEVEEIVELVIKTQTLNKLNSFKFRRLIHQLLGRETSPRIQSQTSQKVFIQLMRIADSSHGPFFFQNIFHKAHSCTFFRAVLSHIPEKQENFTFMMKVVDKIINSLNIQKSLKNATLMQILINRRKSFIKQGMDSKTDPTDTQGFIQTMMSSYVSVSDMETRGRKCVQEMIDNKKTEDLVNGIVSLLKQCSLKSDPQNTRNVDTKGILIDWLTEVDSELITVNKEQQLEVMFGVRKEEYRFYLLSLLCHQTNWDTLYETATTLLSKYNEGFDSSAVLNFIEGIIKNPKLWQGRDRVVSKHEPVDLIYVLDSEQTLVMVEYILNEGKQEIDSADFNNLLHSRVSLFLKIVEEDSLDFVGIVNFVLAYPVSEHLKLKFMQQLYLMAPAMKFQKHDLQKVYFSDVQNLKGCRSDVVVTYLITTLGSLQNKKDFEAMSTDTETLIRKIAASHPNLFLRQLKVISSLLQGKAHMNIGVLRSEFHISRFIQILRLLELLQPHIFDDCYKVGFQTALECYFTFLKHHSRAREAYHILIKFVDILQGYINKSPTIAMSFMEPYTGLLQELSIKNNLFIALQQLVQGLSLLKFKTNDSESELTEEENKLEIDLTEVESKPMDVDEPVPSTSKDTTSSISETDSRGAASFALATGPTKTLAMSPHFIAFVQSVNMSSSEDVILQPLQEIENLTSKRSGYLDPVFHRLLQLIFSLSAQVRSLAYILLIRHLKHNPGKPDVNKATFSAYIQCLKDSNSTVALSAVDNLVDICVLLQEYSVQILQVVFDLGITSKLSTCTQIKRCIQTIKLQHGC